MHPADDVGLEVDARGNLDHLEPRGCQRQHGPLRHIQHPLPLGQRRRSAKRHLLHRGDKLLHPPLADDLENAVADRHLEPPGGERAAEHEPARVLGDVDKAPHPHEPAVEAGDVHIPRRVDLRGPQGSEVEATAVVEVELRRLIDDRLRMA